MKRIIVLLLAILPFFAFAANEQARILRFPTIGGGKIVFTYANDLYSVDANGGTAVKLTSHVGFEVFPKISPDGKTVAFTGQYDGNTEVYTIPIEGGSPKRITYSATIDRDNIGERMGPDNIVMTWTPDGKEIVFRSKWYTFSGLRGQLKRVSVNGGVPTDIPTSEGGFCSYSPDGKQFAFNRMFREFRTWKYYRGGQADDIWINKVGTNSLEKITDNDAQDIFPMWVGDEIFYLSDRDRTMNLFVYNTKTKQTDKLTDFTEYDCKFPSCSKDYVVFENGGYIYKFDVKTRNCEKVTIYLNTDGVYSRPETVKLDRFSSYSLQPDGERLLIEARGEIFSLPAKEGVIYNVSNTPGAHEREIEYSPDGKHFAFFSDKDGEYQVYVASTSDMRNPVKMTDFKDGYPVDLVWGGNSTIYFRTEKRDVYSLNIETKALKRILSNEFNGFRNFSVSPDGKWATYVASDESETSIVYLYDIEKGKSYPVTDYWFNSSNPIFSLDGKYLFFTSSRDYRAQSNAVEWNYNYSVSDYVFVLPLSKETPYPTAIKSDGETPAPSAGSTDVDVKDLQTRYTALNLPAGRYRLMMAADGKLFYSNSGSVKSLDLTSGKSDEVFKGSIGAITADGKKAIASKDGKYYVVNTSNPRLDTPIPMDGYFTIDHKAEWKQIFDESWRVTRDHFYVENMHGVDWNYIHKKYGDLVPYVNHRDDLTYLIGEMIGELNIGHAYITSGEAPRVEKVKTGLLGGKFSKDKSGAFKVEHIFKGASWDASLRSPLDDAGVDVKVGDYILEVDGIAASSLSDIYQALVGKVGMTVSLKVASNPSGKDAHTVFVKPVDSEVNLYYYEWVQGNMAKVDKASNGEIGYIHIPDMSTEGLDMFTKMFYSQLNKKALIIDDRMNGGGNVSPIILERLSREVYRMNMYRNGAGEPVPNEAHYGPKVCLIDKYSSSDGDLFPYGFRKLGLGKLIGKRSWGGIVGISGSKEYLDGQDLRTPFFTSYSTDGEWIIEGHGVDPDIEVDINPFDDYNGKDAQLDRAIQEIMAQLKEYKPLPGVPSAPDKSK